MSKRPFYHRKRLYVLLVVLSLVGYAYSKLDLRLSDGVLSARLNRNGHALKAAVHYLHKDDRRLRYAELGHDSLPLIVFIHGAPASAAFWMSFMTDSALLDRAKVLAIDRPGYGLSDWGRPETSVTNQADLIAEVLRKKRPDHSTILVHGSSYGGTVAARLAMDYPDLVDGLLLQSASLSAGDEKTFWLSYPTTHWSLRWLIPGGIHTASMEKLTHRAELEAMQSGWPRIRAATVILHGTDDWLIYPRNAYYACTQLTGVPYLRHHMVAGRGHDLLWTEPKLLHRSLHRLLDWLQTSSGE